MAEKPSSPARANLQSKSKEDLVEIAKATGVEVPARATKSALIASIVSSQGVGEGSSAGGSDDAPRPSRAVRSRRTVATPDDDFESILKDYAPEPRAAESTEAASPAPRPAREPREQREPREPRENQGGQSSQQGSSNGQGSNDRSNQNNQGPRQNNQGQGERQPRDFGNDANGRNNRRNRRNRNGQQRERFGESMPNTDQPYHGELVDVEGLLDLRDDGYGFLRTKGFSPSPNDVYVSINQVRRFHLRKGDVVKGGFRPAASNEKYPALLRVDTVAGFDPEVAKLRPRFEDLTPLFPDEKLKLETLDGKNDLTPRIVDLLAPIGKGQRGLIVSPPKAGKTTIMKQIAQSIEANNPEVHLMVLLVDERPEEVTDMRRSVSGEVIASTFDRPADEHTHIAELTLERAKRLVEQGRDVVIILDGITRLARAYNLAAPATGRIMSGGVDSGALYPPKKFFGAARNIEEGGSLTILATALVETGSKMDEVIFEEFKGTGNMELKLDRRLAERRLYPAIDVNASSTRHEELLFKKEVLPQVWRLRRVLNGLVADGREAAGLELLIDKLRTTPSNDVFLAEIAKGPAPTS